jgi:hypothetical protein
MPGRRTEAIEYLADGFGGMNCADSQASAATIAFENVDREDTKTTKITRSSVNQKDPPPCDGGLRRERRVPC